MKIMTGARLMMIKVAALECGAAYPLALKYRAIWWRLHASDSKSPGDPRQFAKNLMNQYRELTARHDH